MDVIPLLGALLLMASAAIYVFAIERKKRPATESKRETTEQMQRQPEDEEEHDELASPMSMMWQEKRKAEEEKQVEMGQEVASTVEVRTPKGTEIVLLARFWIQPFKVQGEPPLTEGETSEPYDRDEQRLEVVSIPREIPPETRGGRPRGPMPPNGTQQELRQRPIRLKPEVVCWSVPGKWITGVEIPEESGSTDVTQDGETLLRDEADPTLFHLRTLQGKVKNVLAWGEEEVTVMQQDVEYLVFRMRKNWKGIGRLVRAPTTGYYLVVVPQEWQRDQETSGSAPISPEAVQFIGYKAHFFYRETDLDKPISFVTAARDLVRLVSGSSRFRLNGLDVQDFSEEKGPLFGQRPPSIVAVDEKSWHDVGTIVVGEEGKGGNRWRTHFHPIEEGNSEVELPEELANRLGGWYFVRIYDSSNELLESMDFRFVAGLRDISIEKTRCLPGREGHPQTTVRFLHETHCRVKLNAELGEDLPSVSEEGNETVVVVPPKPCFDKTHWTLRDGTASVDVTVIIRRVWWALATEDEPPVPSEWNDKCLALSREDFLPTGNKTLSLRLPYPRFVSEIWVGFSRERSKVFQIGVEDESVTIPLRDFFDTDEVEQKDMKGNMSAWISTNEMGEEESIIATLPAEVTSRIPEVQTASSGGTVAPQQSPSMTPEPRAALYQCLSCSQVFAPDMISEREIKCPYCGYRIIKKMRSVGIKMVKAE